MLNHLETRLGRLAYRARGFATVVEEMIGFGNGFFVFVGVFQEN